MDFSPKNCKQKRSINGICWSTYIGYWDQMIDPFQMYKLGVWGDIYAFPVIFVSISPHYCTSIPIWGLFAQQNCMSKPSGIQCRQNLPAAFVKNIAICVFSLKLLGYNSPLKLKKLRRHGKFLNFQRLLSWFKSFYPYR